jgi:hypothetical protein
VAISFVASTQVTYIVTGGTTYTVTKPTGVVDGDVCYIFASASDAINGMSGTGWTQLFNVAETGGDSGMWVARKVCAGEGASWAITSTGTETGAAVCLAFRGVDNVTPEGATACASGASAAGQVCGPITVTNSGAWIVCASENDVSTPGGTYSGPGGNFVMQENAMEATLFVMTGAGYENLLGSTGSTSRTLTSSFGADVFVSAALELLPAAVGGTTYLNTHLPFFS